MMVIVVVVARRRVTITRGTNDTQNNIPAIRSIRSVAKDCLKMLSSLLYSIHLASQPQSFIHPQYSWLVVVVDLLPVLSAAGAAVENFGCRNRLTKATLNSCGASKQTLTSNFSVAFLTLAGSPKNSNKKRSLHSFN